VDQKKKMKKRSLIMCRVLPKSSHFVLE